jgi:hypothetical protein
MIAVSFVGRIIGRVDRLEIDISCCQVLLASSSSVLGGLLSILSKEVVSIELLVALKWLWRCNGLKTQKDKTPKAEDDPPEY